ncbi:methyl-accepting chemotaxis protein [Maridesulfovibrio hydrothermalis]|uniref:Methyl-accepting chemotaxis sensory transducer with Cache sensor n=1 Tax=Maridesulfovibrio hydrothermalis AM13 = DSM 14728 TaxID=1121451 RepID=L0R957_9BACT|nr:methyl-accepting chemotaxis protein [Maridesulfovibrio hydrothermalis]CCO23293.1 Methyl-accepting chemotaxis sensory transducer with Cache sensor [Maridesulfovibrio hydrothermalis AM13 = DSM 14728]
MKFKSINTKIAVLIATLVSVSVVAFVVVVSSMTNKAFYEIQKQNMNMMNHQLGKSVDTYLNLSIRELKSFAQNREFQKAFFDTYTRSDVVKSLKVSLAEHGRLTSIAAFNKNAEIVFGVDRTGKDLTGLGLGHRAYIRDVLSGKDVSISKVTPSETGTGNIIIMAVPVRDPSGRVFGGFLISLDWDRYSADLIGDIAIGKQGYVYILSDEGVVIAHGKRPDAVNLDVSSYDFVKQSLAGDDGFVTYEWEGEAKVQSYHRVAKTGWVVCMTAYVSDLTSVATRQRNILIGMGLFMIVVLVGAIVFAIRRQVVAPMARIKDFTAEIENGNFKAELEGVFSCELLELADNIQHMVDELKNKLGFSEGVLKGISIPCIVCGTDEKALFLNKEFLDLFGKPGRPEDYYGHSAGAIVYGDSSRTTIARTVMADKSAQYNMETEIVCANGKVRNTLVNASPLFDLDGHMLGAFIMITDMTEIKLQQKRIEESNIMISEAAASATEVSSQVSSFSEALATQIEQSSRGAEEQSMMASEAATAMDEMNSTVFEVAKNAANAADLAHESQVKAGEGEEMVAKAVETIAQVRIQSEKLQKDMAELGQQAEGIGNIMNVISDIADQTNLLALNAAIEAARAGDAGRGFAVVADEVRKLAEKTMTATNEVGSYIRNIQNSTQKNIASTEESTEAIGEVTDLVNQSGDVLKEIVKSVAATSDQVRSIATASEQQSAASEEISRSTGQINSIAGSTAQAMNDSAKAVSKMSELAQELNEIIDGMQN